MIDYLVTSTITSGVKKRIHDPATVMLMAEDNGDCVGTVRYDLVGQQATISIYVDPLRIGKGYGHNILLKSMHWMKTHQKATQLLAQVKFTNIPSLKLFEGCGFVHSKIRQKEFS